MTSQVRRSSEQIKESFNTSRIYRAIRRADQRRLLTALRRGANVHLYDADNLQTYLHFIVTVATHENQVCYVPMVYMLSNYGIEVDACDVRERTALELAMSKQLSGLCEALIRVGTDLSEKDYRAVMQRIQGERHELVCDTYERFEPGLWGAVRNDDSAQVQLLLNSWCRVNVTRNGRTLLDYARLSGKSPELICALEDADVTLEFVHATLAGDDERMRRLMSDERCDCQPMDISHHDQASDTLTPRSLRDSALALNLQHTLHLLPLSNLSDDHDVTHSDNHTPSHHSTDDETDARHRDLDETDSGYFQAEEAVTSSHEKHQQQTDCNEEPKTAPVPKPRTSLTKVRTKQVDDVTPVPSQQPPSSKQAPVPAKRLLPVTRYSYSSEDAIRPSAFSYGRYRKHDGNFYYASADTNDDHNDAVTSRKYSSLRAKPKQRGRIYWSEDVRQNEEISAQEEAWRPRAKPRKTKRSLSSRLTQTRNEDGELKSRLCVIS